jgi:hypothetical protein
LDSQFRHFASHFWYWEKTWNCAKTIFGAPSILSPPKKTIFFLEQKISQEREFVASQIGDYKKMLLIMQTYLGGQSYYSPPFSFSPLNPVSSWASQLLTTVEINVTFNCLGVMREMAALHNPQHYGVNNQ